MKLKNSKLKDFKEFEPLVNSQLKIVKKLRKNKVIKKNKNENKTKGAFS